MSFLKGIQRFAGRIFRPETASYKDGTTGIGPVADGDTYARRLGRSRFMDRFRDNLQNPTFGEGTRSYADSFDSDRGTRMAMQMFPPRGGAFGELVDGFSVRDEKALYPTGIIQGTKGEKGFGQKVLEAGATAAVGSLFCDVRVKEDISPLQTTEVNDQLAEFAFFVKDLNECS